MKKIFFLILMLPMIVFAYSDYVILGGDTLGIEVNSKGVVVVGFYQVNGNYLNDDLRIGDRITNVNGIEVNSTNSLVQLIDKYMEDSKVDITYYRENKVYKDELDLTYYKGMYRTGLYVKGNILGIGTLTYIDPNTKVYGVLGHGLNMSRTNNKIEIRNGNSYYANVTSFTRSIDGNPGSKNANIDKNNVFGTIESNTDYGVFGKVSSFNNSKLYKVGKIEDIKVGKAYIYTTDTNDNVNEYEIKILEIDKKEDNKHLYFEIVDKKLLKMSGGIVQGMSGSPIVQDDMIIGAVTRVLVDDVSRGYGLSIISMLEEGDKLID